MINKLIVNSIVMLCMTLFFNATLTAQSSSDRDNITVQVDGLGCPFCAYGLEKKFKEFKGIKDSAIDMETGIFTFTYPAEKAIDIKSIEDQVDEAGYTAVTVSIQRADGTVEDGKDTAAELIESSSVLNADFFVGGNCDMCKARIEKTASKTMGVQSAIWDKETQQLSVAYDSSTVSIEVIQERIAEVGHDSGAYRASAEVYDNLPPCCLYDRLPNIEEVETLEQAQEQEDK